ncbi:MAG TPA: ATP-dependent RecD-like DNA helicase, partial [Myxococcota bacterium]|nr:ATP-dependent RecD-like DNA helicase [Myxococcota bacterium]
CRAACARAKYRVMDDRRRAQAPQDGLEGIVHTIRFSNPETFWTVASLRTPSGEVPLIGTLPGLVEGMNVRVEGRWEENPRFGRQYKADRFTEIVPATLEGLERYLASGFIAGIGEKLAQRIVERFGVETISIILNEPERLEAVSGLGKKRAQALSEAFKERRGPQDAMVFLLGLGIPKGLALRILKRYGEDTVAAVRKNPYKLAVEVHGIGFIKADQVARGLDIQKDHPERIRAGLVHTLREARDEGHVRLPRSLLVARASELLEVPPDAIEPRLDDLVSEGRLVDKAGDYDHHIYLSFLHEAELGAAFHIARLLEAAPSQDSSHQATVEAAAKSLGVTLAKAQAAAVELALREPVCVITGGPGTGKTTIIKTLLEALDLPKQDVALAAPTGRAAKRMSEATGRPALTLHRLLEYNPGENGFLRDETDPIDAKLVIVDEASMVDLPLFFALTRALPDKVRLILVGDRDQLPPVGPGAPLTDLIESQAVPVARLTEIFRQGKGSAIVEAAHAINEGRPIPPSPPGQPLSDFYFVQREDPEHIASLIESLVKDRIPERFGLDPARDVQVLTPMRAGPIGVEVLNERLQRLLNPPPEGQDGFELSAETRRAPFRAGDKVMQVKNDYERGVFNGDIGFVRRVEPAMVHVEVDERLVTYDRESLDNLTLAYAVTIHKSQGSEYPAVVIPVSTHHYKMLRRNLLYTGVTRGKRLVVLVGTERAMRIAVGNALVEERNTGLAEVLRLAVREGRQRLGYTPDERAVTPQEDP